jgi:hypothetical protein
MAELAETYMDLPLGIVDAAMITIAERLPLTEIATLDHRHFAVVRPSHASAFILLLIQTPSGPVWRRCRRHGDLVEITKWLQLS